MTNTDRPDTTAVYSVRLALTGSELVRVQADLGTDNDEVERALAPLVRRVLTARALDERVECVRWPSSPREQPVCTWAYARETGRLTCVSVARLGLDLSE